MLPLFVQEIENYLALKPAARAKPTPLFFIFHLFGEWGGESCLSTLIPFAETSSP
jgi:hypothetical protein